MKLPLNEQEYRSVIKSFNNIFATYLHQENISDQFINCIYKWGMQLGISKEDLKYIINNPECIRYIKPDNRYDALEQIYDLVYIIYLDEIIEDNELKVAMDYAKKLGFEDHIIGELLQALVTAPYDGVNRSDVRYELKNLKIAS